MATLKYEEEKSLEVISIKRNPNEILSSPKFQKSKSSTPNTEDSNSSEELIEHTSLNEVKTLSEFTPNLSNELSRRINLTQKLEISNSDEFPQYSLQYAQTLTSKEKQTITVAENTSSKLERSKRSLKVEESNNLVSFKIEEEENSKIIENSVKNNCGQNTINHESELIQLYMNKSSGEQDFDDSESASSSFRIHNVKKKNKTSERTLEKLSKVFNQFSLYDFNLGRIKNNYYIL